MWLSLCTVVAEHLGFRHRGICMVWKPPNLLLESWEEEQNVIFPLSEALIFTKGQEFIS